MAQFSREDGYGLLLRVFTRVGALPYFNNHPVLVSRLLHLGAPQTPIPNDVRNNVPTQIVG